MKKPRFALAKRKAEGLLAEAGVDRAPVDPEALAQLLGAAVRYLPYDGDDGMSGMLQRGQGRAPIIGVNANDSAARQRFTIAHEIGHMQLHAGELHVDPWSHVVHLRDNRSSTAEDVEEIEANQFASNLLMPAKFLESDLRGRDAMEFDELAEELAERYGVSVQAMTLRLAKFLKHGL